MALMLYFFKCYKTSDYVYETLLVKTWLPGFLLRHHCCMTLKNKQLTFFEMIKNKNHKELQQKLDHFDVCVFGK